MHLQDLNAGRVRPEAASAYVLQFLPAHFDEISAPPDDYMLMVEDGWRLASELLEGGPRGFAAGFKFPGCGAGLDFNAEELGNWIRDWMSELGRRERERRAERKHSG